MLPSSSATAGLGELAEEVVWQNLRALSARAALASKRLFGQSRSGRVYIDTFAGSSFHAGGCTSI